MGLKRLKPHGRLAFVLCTMVRDATLGIAILVTCFTIGQVIPLLIATDQSLLRYTILSMPTVLWCLLGCVACSAAATVWLKHHKAHHIQSQKGVVI